MKYLITAFAWLFLTTAGPAAAAEDDSKSGTWTPPLRILMETFDVPAPKHHPPILPMSVILRAASKDHLKPICRNMPRIRDAITVEMYRVKIPSKGNDLILDGVAERFRDAVNGMLGKPLIHSVVVVDGTVQSKSGGINSMPFAVTQGCQAIERWESDKLQTQKSK